MSIVVITGCGSGFGLATALAFAERGDTVVATVRRPTQASSLRGAATSGNFEVDALDVTDPIQPAGDAAAAVGLSRAIASLRARSNRYFKIRAFAGTGTGARDRALFSPQSHPQ